MNKEAKIINLVSASGWEAVFESHGRRTSLPLVAWALVEVEPNSSTHAITGLVLRNGVPTPAHRRDGFKGYEQVSPGKERRVSPVARGTREAKAQTSPEEVGASLWFA